MKRRNRETEHCYFNTVSNVMVVETISIPSPRGAEHTAQTVQYTHVLKSKQPCRLGNAIFSACPWCKMGHIGTTLSTSGAPVAKVAILGKSGEVSRETEVWSPRDT